MTFQSFGKALYLLSSVSVILSILFLAPCCSLQPDPPPICDYSITRVGGFEFVKPVLSTEPACESKALIPMKMALARLTDSLKNAGIIGQASVYFREFERGEWFSVNDAELYHPASLMKVSLLLSVLQIAEYTPGLLEQKLVYEKPASVEITPQFYSFPSIQLGKSYTVHELLYFMIANSDNHATWLLSARVDTARTKKLFFDLGLREPVLDDLKFTMTARECAVFFKAIYNASLLSPEYADYAARLLSNCAFQEGFRKGFPKNTRMWHKFGEWRNVDHDYELHETGVVYVHERPYLVSVMTRGSDTDKLAAAIRVLSGEIAKQLAGQVL